MRTTISLSDGLARDVRRRAAAQGMSVSAFIETLIRAGLHAQASPPVAPPFRLITFDGGGVREGIDLDRAARLVDEEDAASIAKAGR
jgi:plasmid stability protein